MSNNNNKFSTTFVWMAVLSCVCLTCSNIYVPRTWQVGNLPLQLTGGIVLFPISYIINDCLTEVYGYRKTRLVIWMGFTMSLLVSLSSLLVCSLPAPLSPESVPVAEAFSTVFTLVPRTMIASLVAFFVGSTVNSWIMSRMKLASKGKGFGWRAVVSSLGGEFVDSLIFFPFVFWGKMGALDILGVMFTQVLAKTAYEVIILPVTGIIVRSLKQKEGIDTFDNNISYNPFRLGDI